MAQVDGADDDSGATPISGRPADGGEEGVPGIGRVEAFSDGVIAIIITIMVLELKPPERAGLHYLWALWPIGVAYALSFAYVAIYWVNHHRLFSHATGTSNELIWSNLVLLFTLSLVPFSTAYLGQQHFSRDATLVYLATLLLSSLVYPWLQSVVRKTGIKGMTADTYHHRFIRKGYAAAGTYIAGMALSFVSAWFGIAAATFVAILWFLPRSPFDRLFENKAHAGEAI